MAIRTTVGNNRTINASVGEPTTPQVTRLSGGQPNSVNRLTDVDTTQLADGSVLVYNDSSQMWETINTLEKQIVNGGTF